MALIDLSVTLREDPFADPPTNQVKIEYLDHDVTAPGMVVRFPGLSVDDLPDRKAWAVEKLHLSTHNGTHMDAPWHYHQPWMAARGRPPSMNCHWTGA